MVSAGTWRATTRAAGAVIAAIDRSMEAVKAEEPPVTAFCLVRPPGHHACVDGFDSVAGGCGFCVFNAVAVGAAHAIAVHGLKVAIVVRVWLGSGSGHRLAAERAADTLP
eukprot:scaffold123931_cov63-Phaeocystis_antarctica.AAC.1